MKRLPLVVFLFLSGCVSPPSPAMSEPVSTVEPTSPPLGDIHVYVRSPRDPSYHVRYDIRIESPDGQVRNGTVGTDTASMMLEYGGCDHLVSGDFRCREPDTVGPYPYTVFEQAEFNGTWTIRITRTEDAWVHPALPDTAMDPRACAFFGFSKPGAMLRVFQGDPVHEVPPRRESGVGSGTIQYEFWGNATIERTAPCRF